MTTNQLLLNQCSSLEDANLLLRQQFEETQNKLKQAKSSTDFYREQTKEWKKKHDDIINLLSNLVLTYGTPISDEIKKYESIDITG